MQYCDVDSSSSSEDDMRDLKPPFLSQRGTKPIKIVDIGTSSSGKPTPYNTVRKTGNEASNQIEVKEIKPTTSLINKTEKTNNQIREIKTIEPILSSIKINEGEIKNQTELEIKERESIRKENKAVVLDIEGIHVSDDEDFVSVHDSNSQYSGDESSDIIQQTLDNLTKETETVTKKDIACQTIITGEIISMNLYHGDVTNSNMYGMVTLHDIEKQLDVMQDGTAYMRKAATTI
ncbi:hypothetical protein L9F63_019234 [Diploptera punctata]|uniref:Uncharacterized protein n=1 Tax=Diploptera punctata TaxID=6984 RepID=A0AAD7ZUN7_DIPPU|nr:hypothetical protein L9F63_019234 [Diploptera punctata]